MIRLFAIAAASLALLGPSQATADEARACLTRAEQKAALSSGQAVPLATAIRTVRGHGTREVVKARLCREKNGLVYVLTVLARDGKVTRTAVDATSGKVVEVR